MGGRGSGSGMKGSGTSAGGGRIMSALGGRQGVANAVLDEINNHMGRQYKREYAEGLAERGTDSIYFPDMMNYIARNNNVSLPKPENRPYSDVIRDAIGSRAFQQLDSGLRDGAQRWLNDNPSRRRRRR